MGWFGKAFNEETDIPHLAGKVIFITGGNIGLGKASALALAKHSPAHIYLSARSPEKAQATIAEIKGVVPDAPITFIECDLANLSSVQRAAKEFASQSERLDVLLNNAGVMALPPGLTKDGYEIQFGTNHMGHALLVKLLLPVLEKTAAEPGADVRIVSLTSVGHRFTARGGVDFETLKTDMAASSTWTRYGQSKLANILHSKALAKRYPAIKCVAVHPGVVNTNLAATLTSNIWFGGFLKTIVSPFALMTPEQGAWNQLWAATSPDAVSGEYYAPHAATGGASAWATNEKLSDELWEWTQKELETYN